MTRDGTNSHRGGIALRPALARILSREECLEIFKRVCAFAKSGGDTSVDIVSWWQGELCWERNRVSLAGDRREITITVQRTPQVLGSTGSATTNQTDDVSLEGVVQAAERVAATQRVEAAGGGAQPPLPKYELPDHAIWSDATYNMTAEARGEVARGLVDPAEAKGLLSSGYIEIRAGSMMRLDSTAAALRPAAEEVAIWERPYTRWTQAQCSMAMRNQQGTGSGWAGLSSYDWAQIDAAALAARAAQKCVASADSVALEPGRYTVILEPDAVADLVEPLMHTFGEREEAENALRRPPHIWFWREDGVRAYAKLGLKIFDDRITISHDPADPRLGIIMAPAETPGAVNWVERGVLTSLGHGFGYARTNLAGRHGLRGPTGYRISGGSTSVEEMIRTTKRGLLVTRFYNVRVLDERSYLQTGLTRDGLWLIEEGKITKAVKNFRFTESPVFALNNLEQLGEPVPVFRPTQEEGGRLTPAIVPPLKVRDFTFTAMVDSV